MWINENVRLYFKVFDILKEILYYYPNIMIVWLFERDN